MDYYFYAYIFSFKFYLNWHKTIFGVFFFKFQSIE
jgi:hypothetical protein